MIGFLDITEFIENGTGHDVLINHRAILEVEVYSDCHLRVYMEYGGTHYLKISVELFETIRENAMKSELEFWKTCDEQIGKRKIVKKRKALIEKKRDLPVIEPTEEEKL